MFLISLSFPLLGIPNCTKSEDNHILYGKSATGPSFIVIYYIRYQAGEATLSHGDIART